ncbi:DUF2017 family protein [Leucobacter sp. UT-8R-CII-1-4]|uniref:DUF2017 family protein n=1 Tax=Leucobacter sp. UT-8R-CII-1-4 TaxID=3040075 RepID=UPI0024A8EA3A|nr:DUF2017 family protein [Leucobacter sp. UT-8R-CII-1-4]MDI6024593.1 DUF2017 family protein [Leucobacter sp. UT-8R-CII-1-4]
MRLLPLPGGILKLRLEFDEAQLLDGLVSQLIDLLQSHSQTTLDPDPLFASLEVGGSDSLPEDPALARLFPDAFEDEAEASAFRRLNEQGLVNRKMQDALDVSSALGLGNAPDIDGERIIEVDITARSMSAWVRTLTALRIAIAARIGLNAEGDQVHLLASDETRGTVLVYDWLAAILDSILRMSEEAAEEPEDTENG